MEENKKEPKVIDVIDLSKKLWAKKKIYAKTLPVAFVVACIYILGFPRYYKTDIKLAPELGGSSMSSTFGSLASSFGLNIDNLQSNDAITPLLYPDLMEDNGFVASLFNVQVESKDGSIKTTYYDYLEKKQRPVIWLVPVSWVKNLFNKKQEGGTGGISDPYNLSKKEDDIAGSVRDKIKINFDRKTAVINISVKDQDALICKAIADSVKERLQDFITNYRTSKARNDYEYYLKLTTEAKENYDKAQQQYGRIADAYTRVTLKSSQLKLVDMESDLQLKYSAYTTLSTQLEASKAKVQERTPAFTVIKGANVPIKPSAPKRMVFVAIILLLTFAGTSIYILSKQ